MVDDETEANLLRKPQAVLSFALHLNQLISCCQHVFDQMVAAITRKGKVTDFVGSIEGPDHKIAPGPDMFCPWQNDISEGHIRPSLKTLQSAFFDQIIAELDRIEIRLYSYRISDRL